MNKNFCILIALVGIFLTVLGIRCTSCAAGAEFYGFQLYHMAQDAAGEHLLTETHDYENTDMGVTFHIQNNTGSMDDSIWYVDFNIVQDCLYKITVTYYDQYTRTAKPIRYKLTRGGDGEIDWNTATFPNDTVGLCVTNVGTLGTTAWGGLPPPSQVQEGNTQIQVIMEQGYWYRIKLPPKTLIAGRTVDIKIEAIKSAQTDLFYSYVPSSYVSMQEIDGTDKAQGAVSPFDKAESLGLEDTSSIIPYKSGVTFVKDKVYSFKNVVKNLLEPDIKRYARECGLVAAGASESEASFLESAITSIIMFFGEILLHLAETFIGTDNLTLDKLIFNKLTGSVLPVIDLSKYGGIPLGNEYSGSVLAKDEVVNVITNVYSGLKYIGIIVYMISLLYVGFKTLMAVGTKDESKTKKYIEYWVTGAILFFVIPYFLPVLPYITNKLTTALSENAKSMGEFSVTYIASKLGVRYFGEDADTAALRTAILARLEALEVKMNKQRPASWRPISDSEIPGEFDRLLAESGITRNNYVTPTQREQMRDIFVEICHYINENADNWDLSKERVVEEKINEIKGILCGGATINSKIVSAMVNFSIQCCLSHLKPGVTAYDARQRFRNLLVLAKTSGATGGSVSPYARLLLSTYLDNDGVDKAVSILETFITQVNRLRESSDAFGDALGTWLLDDTSGYMATAVIYQYGLLEKMQDSITTDPMYTLKELAGTTHRVVYAIAWCILLFQLFALVFMYYKRIFVVAVLVCIFPLVMALYVIDKMGDGQAQSLQNWFKEFFANCVIQFFHAAIYLILVNIGIKIASQDPSRDWFFLVLCISFLFPAEKLLRGMVGLQASTIGGLKLNIVAGIVALKTLGSNAVNLGKGAFNGGVAAAKGLQNFHAGRTQLGMSRTAYLGKLIRDDVKKTDEKYNKKGEEKKKKKKEHHDSRDQNRRNRIEIDKKAKQINSSERTAMDKLHAARGTIRDTTGKIKENVSGKLQNVGDKVGSAVANSKIGKAASNIAGKAGDLAGKVANSKVGRIAGASLKFAGKTAKYAGQKMWLNKGKIAKGMRKGIQMGAAISKGIDKIGDEGLAGGAAVFGQLSTGVIGKHKLNTGTPDSENTTGYDPGTLGSTGSSKTQKTAQGIRNKLGRGTGTATASGDGSAPPSGSENSYGTQVGDSGPIATPPTPNIDPDSLGGPIIDDTNIPTGGGDVSNPTGDVGNPPITPGTGNTSINDGGINISGDAPPVIDDPLIDLTEGDDPISGSSGSDDSVIDPDDDK